MSAVNVRLPLREVTQLHKLAAAHGTSFSEEVRAALAAAHDARLEAIEWEGLTGGVVLTLRHVDGWIQSAAFDVDQAREIARHLEHAIEQAEGQS